MVGGNLEFLEGGSLTAREGRIELGSVAANSLVSLNEIETNYALGYAGVENFGDITLFQGAVVDASGEGGGAIQVQGKNINLTESFIAVVTQGSTPGKNLEINASESLQLSGGAQILTSINGEGEGGDVRLETSSLELSGGAQIVTFTQGEGKAGDAIVKASSLKLREGAQIASFTQGKGEAGDVIVKDSDSISLDGSNSTTGFFAQVLEGTGNGGNINIETRVLNIKGGAAINASTFGAGNAGNISVKASDSIELDGRTPDEQFVSGIFAQVEEQAENAGNAGTITIETRQLTLEAGAQISSAARKSGNGGSVNINASDSITLTGSSPTATLDSGSSGIFATAEGEAATGNPGQLDISTGMLTVENGGKISANNRSTGQQQGNLTLNVDNLIVRDGGFIQAGTFNTEPRW